MPRARRTDPLTSHQAAQSVSEKTLTTVKKGILKLLAQKPMCDETLFDEYCTWACGNADFGQRFPSPSGLRSRRSELVDEGLVIDSGQRVKMRSGRNAIVWVVAP